MAHTASKEEKELKPFLSKLGIFNKSKDYK